MGACKVKARLGLIQATGPPAGPNCEASHQLMDESLTVRAGSKAYSFNCMFFCVGQLVTVSRRIKARPQVHLQGLTAACLMAICCGASCPQMGGSLMVRAGS
jgi:hypothetical protein